MNILFLASTFPRFANDLQAPFVLEQSLAWKDTRPNDRVFVLAPHDPQAEREEEIDGVSVHRFCYMRPEGLQRLAYPAILPNIKRNPLLASQVPPFLFSLYREATTLVRKHKIDLIYAHWVLPQGLAAYWLSKSTGVPFVVQNHSSDLRVFWKFGAAGRSMARRILERSSAFFCVNRSQKDDAMSLFEPDQRSHFAEKVTVLPMGVNIDPDTFDHPADTNCTAARFNLGMISRLSRKKGVDLFIRALDGISEKVADVKIGIAGDGEDRELLMNLPRDPAIDFIGFVSGEEKLAFFRDTNCLAFPSISVGGDVEGLPVALLEALFCGKISLASRDTNIEMLPEWDSIKEHVFFLPDPTDTAAFTATIERMLKLSASEIAVHSEQLRRTMSRYHWNNLIKEYQSSVMSRLPQTQ